VKIDFDLNLRYLFLLLSFLFTNLLTNMLFMSEEKRFIKSVCQSKGSSTKRICKEFSIKKWAVSSAEDQCKMQKINSTERKTGEDRPQTARSEQNYRHMTELICSQEGNTGSSRSPREMINPTVTSLSSGAARSCHGHKHVSADVFSHCVKMLLGHFNYMKYFCLKS